ncbi:MAG TPA: IS4 family transposase [Ktedonobacteraceae bacterium]
MITIPRMAKVLRKVFESDARSLARSMGVIQRERKFTGTTLALVLVLGWLHQPQAGSSALARFAGTLGVQISKQGIEEHWTFQTAQWLYEVLLRAIGTLLSAKAVAVPLLRRFSSVYLEDGSSVVLPDALERCWRGCRGGNGSSEGTKAGVKLTLRLDLVQGTLHGPLLQEGRAHESHSLLQSVPLTKGALWIADMGYFALVRLAQVSQVGAYFLMPLKDGVMTWLEGKRVDILSLLQACGAEEQEYEVDLGAAKQVHCRVVARRASEEQVKRRHKKQDEYARKHGTVVSQRQRDWACWLIVITNVPMALLTLAEAFVLLRCRWQIELLWKLWKMQGLVDEWQTSNEQRILCEVYAKLLGLLLQHWMLLLTCWEDPHRSWITVSQIVRDQTVVLAHGFGGRLSLTRALRLMGEAIMQAAGRSIPGRSDRPSTSRLLLAFGETGLT